MTMPRINPGNLKQPLCYDPERKKFILFREIASGKEKIVPIEKLSPGELKLLILERQRKGPDYTIQAVSGPPYTRDDIVQAILRDEEIGKMTVEAEISMLKDLLQTIRKNLVPGKSKKSR